jgi:hypothetical protein
MEKKCPNCGEAFQCNLEQHCWCFDLPHIPMPAESKGCLCPACLSKEIEAIKPGVLIDDKRPSS